MVWCLFCFSSRRRHTRCALVTGVQTCALPILLLAGALIAWSVFRCSTTQKHIKRDPRATLAEMRRAVRDSIWAIVLPIFVLGGMYFGIFTATEAAAAGVWLALFVTVVIYKTVGWREIWESAQEACRLSAMLFMILAGAAVFSHVLTKMRVPQQIVESLAALDIGATGFILVMMLLVMVLGMFLESIAIILINMPVILPAMVNLGIDPIWYGVLLDRKSTRLNSSH